MADVQWFDSNTARRRKLLVAKAVRYKDSWRNYPIMDLLKLSLHRLDEVVDRFKATGSVDMDNIMDSMNFSDMALAKSLEAKQTTGKSK